MAGQILVCIHLRETCCSENVPDGRPLIESVFQYQAPARRQVCRTILHDAADISQAGIG